MRIVGDTTCPGCRASGGDSKGNHLILFEGDQGEKFAKCPKCGHYEKDPSSLPVNKKKEWNQDELKKRLEEIREYPTRNLDTRRIPDWVCDHYGVRVGLSTSNGTEVVEHYYPRLNEAGEMCRYNVRVCDPKAFYSIGPQTGALAFGAEHLNKKGVRTLKLWIFEDELSAMSGYFVIKQQLANSEETRETFPACISLPAGSGTIVQCLQWLIDNDYIEKFEEIVYVHDNDRAGYDSYETGRAFLPTLHGVTTQLKDANDMLMEGRHKELFRVLSRGTRVRSPDGAATVSDAMRDAEVVLEEGYSLPWSGLSDLVKVRWGELWSIGGPVGGGKTTLVHAICAHFIKEHKIPSACFMMEERIGKTLINVSTQLTRTKTVGFEKDRQQQINETYNLDELLHLWKNKGQNDWDNISQCIRYYASVHGVKLFFVDNITALTNTLSSSEINTEVARIATEAHGLCDELNICIMILSHLNPAQSGKSHEAGGQIFPVQFTGGRGLMRWSEVMIGFERNMYADGDEKHYSRIRVLKDRENGKTGFINTRYDPETGGLDEHDQDIPDSGPEVERF